MTYDHWKLASPYEDEYESLEYNGPTDELSNIDLALEWACDQLVLATLDSWNTPADMPTSGTRFPEMSSDR